MNEMLRWIIPAFLSISLAVLPGRVGSEPIDLIFTCVADRTPPTITVDHDHVDLHRPSFVTLDAPFILAHGWLGWHTTWAVLIDTSATPVRAFETHHPDDAIHQPFYGRMPVPPVLKSALIECGVAWAGYWADDWPRNPSSRPGYDLLNLTPEKLLPP
ncbi:hypothetical protein [Ovoidimarina sediminis]|uniref:hypothetical protein n=1 Tax=Ovoidimarina sediminis TaxID=3079856 RepID=UPI00291324FE|nr:hypothetical protein [Rhodophyticola sp. MJ-SS7]MDU8943889.1 hypothetical protein [Rhodophyticola sp. MJ-SS7]